MRILSINKTDITQMGGINYSVRRISEELAKRGHECSVVSINPGGLPDKESINGVNIVRVRSRVARHLYGLSVSVALFLRANLGKVLSPDIVHIHEYRSLLTPEVAYILRSKHLPFVFSPHYDRLGYNSFAGRHFINLYKPLGNVTFDWAERVVANSQYTKGILLADLAARWDKIEVIPHGVDKLADAKDKAKKAKHSPISLLYVGVLTRKKCVHYIIEALGELRSRGIQADLSIVGEGDREHELRELAKALMVEASVSWCGPLFGKELNRKYTEADILLLLSRDESYGIVVAESLAAGTPCIVTRTTALTEFLTEPGCFGVDYPPDPKEVADLISRIHASEVKVGPFSDKVRTWDRVSVDYEELYERVIGERRRETAN